MWFARCCLAILAACRLFAAVDNSGDVRRRLVILEVDGLPQQLLERYLARTDAAGGKPKLPWIDRVFVSGGTSLDNFYVRGISLSAPSWSLLNTGRHLVIHGNVEYDRFTLRSFDYLNFFPFYVSYARSRRVDMPGVEVLDEAGVPLLMDRYAREERYQSMQTLQRAVRWKTLQGSLTNRFSRGPATLFNEWQAGFEMSRGIAEQEQRELIQKLQDPRVLYLDYYFGDYDHVGHLSNDEAGVYTVLRSLDTLVGRLWTAIQATPMAGNTVFVLVSDHGMNSSPRYYSQGWSLVDFFTGAGGGAHHVVTNRHPLTEYKIRGLDPFVSEVVTHSARPLYPHDPDSYPTVLLDLDGNERASVHLRNNGWNELHILLEQFLAGRVPRAAVLAQMEEMRPEWERTERELHAELAALHRRIQKQEELVASLPATWSPEDREAGRDQDARREHARLQSWLEDERGYGEYVRILSNLLKLEPAQLAPGHVRIENLIPRRSMGAANTIYDLQNYAAGPGERSGFERINYFARLAGARVRNTVQEQVGPKPVDFIAARLAREPLRSALTPADAPDQDGIWLYASETSQAFILARESPANGLQLRYIPVSGLAQDRDGTLHFQSEPWRDGLPLNLFEDPALNVDGDRAAWLNAWHTDREWLEATHRTRYSNAVVGLHEQFRRDLPQPLHHPVTADEQLLRRFEERRRGLAQADLLVVASNGWNFNVRGFNPGGNHGSFFRISTHSVLMLAGAGVPRGVHIERPYDSLSYAPTLLGLTHAVSLRELRSFPGPFIEELNPAISYNCCR